MSTTKAQIIEAYPQSQPIADKIVEVAYRLNIDPSWLANIIRSESNFNPKALNLTRPPSGGNPSFASGLIQFMPSTAKSNLKKLYGTTYSSQIGSGTTYIQSVGKVLPQSTDKVLSMSGNEQMELVYQYLKSKGKLKSQSDVVLAVFYPYAIGKGANFDIADHYAYKGGKYARGSAEYNRRYKYLQDINGGITYAKDYEEKLSKYWKLKPADSFKKSNWLPLISAIVSIGIAIA